MSLLGKILGVKPPFLALAPMAGLTHAAFRELVAEFSGCNLFFTEMLNVRAIVFQNPEKDPYLRRGRKDRPLVAQLVGREPHLFAKAVQKLEELFDFDGYDLNFGCARGAIQRYGWGVSLMKEPSLACEIVRAVCENTSKPVSAKIRSGWEHDRHQLLAFASRLVDCGVSFLTLHPRSAKEGFKRPARWEEIRWLAAELPLPVIGNGDVFGPADAQRLFEETGCAGVMIGRAALLRPWIFRDIKAYLAGDLLPPPPSPEDPPQRLANLLREFLPQDLQEKRFSLWLFWYLQNFRFGLYYFREIQKAPGLEGKVAKLKELLESENFPPYPARPYLHR